MTTLSICISLLNAIFGMLTIRDLLLALMTLAVIMMARLLFSSADQMAQMAQQLNEINKQQQQMTALMKLAEGAGGCPA